MSSHLCSPLTHLPLAGHFLLQKNFFLASYRIVVGEMRKFPLLRPFTKVSILISVFRSLRGKMR